MNTTRLTIHGHSAELTLEYRQGGVLDLIDTAHHHDQTVAVSGDRIFLLAGDPDPFGSAEIVETLGVDDRLPDGTLWRIRTFPNREAPWEGTTIALARTVAEAETLMKRHLNGPGGLSVPSDGDANWHGTDLVFEYRDSLKTWADTQRRADTRYYRLSTVKIGELL